MGDGRWPANVILSPDMAEALDVQSGTLKSGKLGPKHTDSGKSSGTYGAYSGREITQEFGGDSGGASRFFLNAGYEPWELEWIYANGLRPCGE